jgi:hypothetical protein
MSTNELLDPDDFLPPYDLKTGLASRDGTLTTPADCLPKDASTLAASSSALTKQPFVRPSRARAHPTSVCVPRPPC